ncbi:hypothetical protein [Actinoplanes sp. HUAS TT8]|uniref:hypothetical protein n=1 Tax=Actinoplanes sp. HUAS TT8 TaxID=3447453 RepID=UPI003F51E4E6
MVRTGSAGLTIAVVLVAAAGCSHQAATPVTAPATDATSTSVATGTVLFTEAPPSPSPSPHESSPAPSGTQYGYITAVDTARRTVTYDKIDWFTGAAAAKACAADGVAPGDGARCHDYYIRNHNRLLRTVSLSPTAKLTLQSPNDILVQLEISLAELAAEHDNRLFILTFTSGAVSRVAEQFLP